MAIIEAVTARSATIPADEASHWNVLHASYPVSRINHSEAYCLDGACANQAVSYCSRLRRMVAGQHHYVSPRYLHQYATHAAWIEDHRLQRDNQDENRAAGMTAQCSRGQTIRVLMTIIHSRVACQHGQVTAC